MPSPCYPPPHHNDLPGATNSMPSSVPVIDLVGQDDLKDDEVVASLVQYDLNDDEADGEEREGGVGVAKKWSMDEDMRLINAWIHTSTTTGADQKKTGFWKKLAAHVVEHTPPGATPRTAKTCNSRWNRATKLVSKWASIVDEIRFNHSGADVEEVLASAHALYFQRTGKKFELEHWWRMVRDQPKWKALHNQCEGGLSKRSKINEMGERSDTSTPTPTPTPTATPTPAKEGPVAEEDGELSRPNGSKASKRKAKQKAIKAMHMVSTSLSTVATSMVEKVDLFRQYVKVEERKAAAAEEAVRLRSRRQAFKEVKWEEKIMRMNTANMCSEDAAYYNQLKEQIRNRYHRPPPSMNNMSSAH